VLSQVDKEAAAKLVDMLLAMKQRLANGNRGAAAQAQSRVQSAKTIAQQEQAESLKKEGDKNSLFGYDDEAIVAYTEAIRLNPAYVDAYADRGKIYEAQKRYDMALQDYNKVIELDDQDNSFITVDYYVSRAGLLFLMKKYDAVIQDCEKIFQLDNNFDANQLFFLPKLKKILAQKDSGASASEVSIQQQAPAETQKSQPKGEALTFQLNHSEHPQDFERMTFVLKALSTDPTRPAFTLLHVEQTQSGSRLVVTDGVRIHVAEISARITSGNYKPHITKDTISLGEPVEDFQFPNWAGVVPAKPEKRGVINLKDTGMGENQKQTERLSIAFNDILQLTGETVNQRFLEDLSMREWGVYYQGKQHTAIVLKEEGAETDTYAVIMPYVSPNTPAAPPVETVTVEQTMTPQPEMKPAAGFIFCTNCGTKLNAGSKFCPNCGTKVITADGATTETPEAVAPVAHEAPESVKQAADTNRPQGTAAAHNASVIPSPLSLSEKIEKFDGMIQAILEQKGTDTLGDQVWGRNIPAKKLDNISKSLQTSDDERVFILFDDTVFGSAKTGMIITSWGIRYKPDSTDEWKLSWKTIVERYEYGEYTEKKKSIPVLRLKDSDDIASAKKLILICAKIENDLLRKIITEGMSIFGG
jgi:tetratricopeptide (TPR) repeat protein/uncharacterized Zn finger protein (UPF0148 family)